MCKLGRDKLKEYATSGKDDIEEQLRRDKLNVADGELKCEKLTKKWRTRKVDGS
jgi:hypothetical protein